MKPPQEKHLLFVNKKKQKNFFHSRAANAVTSLPLRQRGEPEGGRDHPHLCNQRPLSRKAGEGQGGGASTTPHSP